MTPAPANLDGFVHSMAVAMEILPRHYAGFCAVCSPGHSRGEGDSSRVSIDMMKFIFICTGGLS